MSRMVMVRGTRNSYEEHLLASFGSICGGFVTFPGQCDLQAGDYIVDCHAINRSGEIVGGGSVAGFMRLADAKACVEWVNNQDPRHEAVIGPNPQDGIDYVRIQ